MLHLKLSPHAIEDLETYGCFFLGVVMFLFKRARIAVLSRTALFNSRWQFFKGNIDTIVIRGVLEILVVYYPARHYSIATILGLFGITLNSTWGGVLAAIPDSAVSMIAIGFFADSIVDWLTLSKRLPDAVRDWLSENVPRLPEGMPQQAPPPQNLHDVFQDKLKDPDGKG